MFWLTRIFSIIGAIGFCFLLDSVVKSQLNDLFVRLIVLAALYVTLAVSLNLVNGITGQFSIGHAAFYQIGAYSAGYLSVNFFAKQPLSQVPWMIVVMAVGAVASGIAGFFVGLPSLRLRGDYLGIVTLGFGEIIRIVTQNVKAVGAASGMQVTPKMIPPYVWLAWLLAILCIATCRNLLRTAHGLPFLAVREDEVASGAMGVNVTRVKVTAFVIGSAFAGAAGAFYGHMEGFLSPQMFTMETSFIILTMVVLGGTGSITGSVVAAILLSALPELLRFLGVVTMPGVLAATLVILAAVAGLRWMGANVYDSRRKLATGFAIIGGALVAFFLLRLGIMQIGSLSKATIESSKLRLVIFAATLVILMLLRPQGIFAHHEFSWDWVRRVFGRRREVTA